MKILSFMLCAIVLITLAPCQNLNAAASCESLASLALPQTQITRAQLVSAGQFAATPAGVLAPGAPSFRPYSALPAFCHVTASIRPSSDSDIKIEVWMPAEGWNGKFEGVGNGGWAGTISLQALAAALGRGYAAAATDTGHAGPGGSFAFNHPEKLTDFAYRAVHEMTVQAKAIIRAYYGNAPKTSYWIGCSTGGRQGLIEAQRYPDDYDGIVAGAPANYMTHLLTQSIWVAQAVLKDPASYIPKEKYATLHQAVLDACDGLDGIKDGVLDDPTRCHLDPKTIQCSGDDASTCLTAAQVEAEEPSDRRGDLPRTGAWQRTGMGGGPGCPNPAQHRDRLLQIHRVHEARLGLQDAGLRQGRRAGRLAGQRRHERDRSEP
jgi:feruloyl esterase